MRIWDMDQGEGGMTADYCPKNRKLRGGLIFTLPNIAKKPFFLMSKLNFFENSSSFCFCETNPIFSISFGERMGFLFNGTVCKKTKTTQTSCFTNSNNNFLLDYLGLKRPRFD